MVKNPKPISNSKVRYVNETPGQRLKYYICFVLAPFTKYRLMVRAFTKRREGPSSEAIIIITDTEAPSSPRITNISCYGNL